MGKRLKGKVVLERKRAEEGIEREEKAGGKKRTVWEGREEKAGEK